jgi:hypothetical protein
MNYYWDDWTRVVAGKIILQWAWFSKRNPENQITYAYIGYDIDGNTLIEGVAMSRSEAQMRVKTACQRWIDQLDLQKK